MEKSVINISEKTKTLIIIGSGGVGKTTLAASVAVGEASRGKKVLVLTIDPSNRLAQALNLKADGEIHKVPLEFSSIIHNPMDGVVDQNKNKGELFSSVINHKKAFESFIRKAAGQKVNPADINKLLKNKLYQQLSGQLGGSQEFTSLVTLYQHVQSEVYDLVILDTPPSQHTWNFLHAPEKIAALFNDGVAKWFRDPSEKSTGLFKRVLNTGATQVLKALEYLTGSEFIQALSEFFKAIQNWQGPLERYVLNCHKLLIAEETEFIIVTGLDHSRMVEAEKISREIKKEGYQLTSVIINRVPIWLSEKPIKASPRIIELYNYYRGLQNELSERTRRFAKGLSVYSCPEFDQQSYTVEQLKKCDQNITLLKV